MECWRRQSTCLIYCMIFNATVGHLPCVSIAFAMELVQALRSGNFANEILGWATPKSWAVIFSWPILRTFDAFITPPHAFGGRKCQRQGHKSAMAFHARGPKFLENIPMTSFHKTWNPGGPSDRPPQQSTPNQSKVIASSWWQEILDPI